MSLDLLVIWDDGRCYEAKQYVQLLLSMPLFHPLLLADANPLEVRDWLLDAKMKEMEREPQANAPLNDGLPIEAGNSQVGRGQVQTAENRRARMYGLNRYGHCGTSVLRLEVICPQFYEPKDVQLRQAVHR